MGNDGQIGISTTGNEISIHVPSWGTTNERRFILSFSSISIHVPSWGTTFPYAIVRLGDAFQSTFPRGERRRGAEISHDIWYFNPRSLVGNDAIEQAMSALDAISIHVPSWGTTANFHKYSLFFYAINIIFLLFIIPSLFSLVLFMLLFWFL